MLARQASNDSSTRFVLYLTVIGLIALAVRVAFVPAAVVTLTVALTWGAARFRLPAEVAFIVLAAVACDACWRRLAPDRAQDRLK